jgi:hypothetical protein
VKQTFCRAEVIHNIKPFGSYKRGFFFMTQNYDESAIKAEALRVAEIEASNVLEISITKLGTLENHDITVNLVP